MRIPLEDMQSRKDFLASMRPPFAEGGNAMVSLSRIFIDHDLGHFNEAALRGGRKFDAKQRLTVCHVPNRLQ